MTTWDRRTKPTTPWQRERQWILSKGFWNDDVFWIDNNVWKDSI